MTEQEWLTSDDPKEMLEFLLAKGIITGRKMRLFEVGWWRYLPPHQDEHEKVALAVEEHGSYTDEESGEIFTSEELGHECWTYNKHSSRYKVGAYLLRCIFGNPFQTVSLPRNTDWDLWRQGGGPGRVDMEEPPKYKTPWLVWNDCTIPRLAQAIYDDRAWDRLPMLADAMEEAGVLADEECRANGCFEGMVLRQPKGPSGQVVRGKKCPVCHGSGRVPNPLLAHLRSDGPHARGCHVLDLILGKE